MQIYGAVIVRGPGYISQPFYEDQDMTKLDPDKRWLYGIDWVYDGDQGWEESCIYAEFTFNDGDIEIFEEGGRNALKQFLIWRRQVLERATISA